MRFTNIFPCVEERRWTNLAEMCQESETLVPIPTPSAPAGRSPTVAPPAAHLPAQAGRDPAETQLPQLSWQFRYGERARQIFAKFC